MSGHYPNYVASSSPSITNPTSPTTSTELLISAPPRQQVPMQGASQGESSKGSSIRSSSTVKRSRIPPREPDASTEGHDELGNTLSQTSTTDSSPQNLPPAHVHSSHVSNDPSPSISPSALEAGFAKEPDSRHVSRTATGDEKCDSPVHDGLKVWPPWKRDGGWAGWRTEWVKKEALVVPLVVQAFSAGILDATTYADFMTFASNQTGNTILLCVSVAGTVSGLIKLTAISLGAFLSAAFIFGHLGHYFGLRQRGWILMTTTWQIITLLVAAILCSPHGPPIFHIGGQHDWFILFLFAHMSGAQVAQARQSSNQELPTAPMTSSYVDLMSEKYLFVGFRHKKAGPRNRKLAYTSSMIIGGLLGAVIHKFAGSWEVVVVTMMLKVVMLGLVCRANADEDKDS